MDYTVEELSLEISNACLLTCRHCSSGSTLDKLPNELSMEDHVRLIKEARALGARTLSLSGGDPILLDQDLFVLVDTALNEGYGRVLIYSTGIHRVYRRNRSATSMAPVGAAGLNTWAYVDWLKRYQGRGVEWIFSLHSHNPSTNDFIMNLSGAWLSITEGIEYLVRTIQIPVQIHYVPTLVNYKDLPHVRLLCEWLGVPKMSVLRFVPQTRGAANRSYLDLGVREFAELQRLMDQESQLISSVELRFGCPVEFRHVVPGTSINQAGSGKVKACHAGRDLILVRPDGTVHPCAAWKSLPTDSNVRDHPLSWIWENDSMFQAIRAFEEHGYAGMAGTCKFCQYLESCRGGCPAQKLHAARSKDLMDMWAPLTDPLCPKGGQGENRQ